MAVTELARIIFALNTIMEKASSAAGLSKRGALALAILDALPVMTNKKLQERFVTHSISTPASAAKDVSSAKSELLDKEFIEIGRRTAEFSINAAGREVVMKMYASMGSAIDMIGLDADERALLRRLSGLDHSGEPAARGPERTRSLKKPAGGQLDGKPTAKTGPIPEG
jgi:hypothetical protein